MSRRFLVVALCLSMAAVAALALWPAPAPRSAAPSVAAAAPSAAPSPSPAPGPVATTTEARYRLSLTTHVLLNDKEAASVQLAGVWTATPRLDGRTEVRLAVERSAVEGAASPTAADLAQPFVLVQHDGRLVRLAFAPGTPDGAKNLLASAATLLQVTLRDGADWTATEQDLTGRYEARYAREGGVVHRARGRYRSLHEAQGLGDDPGDLLRSDEDTTIAFDADGLVSMKVRLAQDADLKTPHAVHVPKVQMSSEATLVRVDTRPVALVAAPDFPEEPIHGYRDRAAAERASLRREVGDASVATLLGETEAAARLDRKAPGTNAQRQRAMQRMIAMAKLDPESARSLADHVRAHPADATAAGMVAAALGQAGTPEATHELASLLAESLPGETRQQVVVQLGLAATPDAETTTALAGELDGSDATTAALALGAEAKKLGDEEEPARDAIDELLQRYAAARDREEARGYLVALGNTGSRRVLPALTDTIRGKDYGLAEVATVGLRFIPGDDVDAMLESFIASGSAVIVPAIRAVGYRSRDLWLDKLQAFEKQFAGHKHVTDALDAVIAQWTPLAQAAAPASQPD